MKRINYRQIEQWQSLLLLSRQDTVSTVCSRALCSPWTVATACGVRKEQLQILPGELIAPCDLHVMGIGSAPDRTASRVGGLPYRPADLDWPRDSGEVPYKFFCQFDFSQSNDLFPALPGDILLVFSRDGTIVDHVEDQLRFEWYHISDSIKLIQENELPKYEWWNFIGYGVPCRTFDFFDQTAANQAFEELRGVLPDPEDIPDQNPSRFIGFKIGGLPAFWHEPLLDRRWGNAAGTAVDLEQQRLYLGGIGIIFPESNCPLP